MPSDLNFSLSKEMGKYAEVVGEILVQLLRQYAQAKRHFQAVFAPSVYSSMVNMGVLQIVHHERTEIRKDQLQSVGS